MPMVVDRIEQTATGAGTRERRADWKIGSFHQCFRARIGMVDHMLSRQVLYRTTRILAEK